ncbi:hypothetical protein E4U13_006322 [Claviceps humidiphila]|uniref:Uncharacterized protein n=1 Tax=Claviceps humidiphila TaxID=1294629 RepID=A0A9P7TSD4_9HYPO|nr:hypothetical protein E4U13_006322 [Claviceps humidiphila]
MSMMAPFIFSASINRAAVLNNRGSSSIRGRGSASRRHGLDVSRYDLEDGLFHAQMAPSRFERLYRGVQNRLGRLRQPRDRVSSFSHQMASTDSLEPTPAELERVDHHSENGARSPRGLCRLFNFRPRHLLMGQRDVAFSPFNQSVLGSRLASGTRRLLRRTLRFASSENQWVSVEGRIATPYASTNGDDEGDSEYEPPEEYVQNRRSDGWNSFESSSYSVFEAYPPSSLFGINDSRGNDPITRVFLHDRIRPGPCRWRHNRPNLWVSHEEELLEDVIRVRTGQVRHGNVLANRAFGAPALEDGSPPLYSDDNESPPEYDDTAFLGSPLYRLHNGMLLDIHHAALQADDFIRYYGDDPNRIPRLGPRGRAYLESQRENFALDGFSVDGILAQHVGEG